MKHYAHNPRQISKKELAQLKNDLAELGDLGGFVHDLETDEIISGNQRSEVIPGILSGKLKPIISHTYEPPNAQGTVAVGFIEWQGEQFKYRAVRWDAKTRQRANIRANKAGGWWDWDELANAFDVPDLIEWGFSFDTLRDWQTGVSALGNLLGSEEEQEPTDAEPQEITETEAEKLAKEYGIQEGQVWRLGRHTIACVDCLDAEKVAEIIAGIKIGMVFSDPPYGVNIVATNGFVGGGESAEGMIPFGGKKRNGYVGGGKRIKTSPGLYPLEAREKAKRLGSEKVRGTDGSANLIEVGKYAPVIGDENKDTAKRSASFYTSEYSYACHVWWGANYYTDVLTPSPGWIVWDKDNTGNFADCEMAWTNQPRPARIFEHRWNGMLKATEQGQRRIHPTQKPVALADYVFREYGKTGDVILDPFLGSGITVLAAESLGDRTVIGFELSPAYIGATIKRWEFLTGEKAVLLR